MVFFWGGRGRNVLWEPVVVGAVQDVLSCDGWKVKLAVGASADAAGLGRAGLKGGHLGVFIWGSSSEVQICVEIGGKSGIDVRG